MSLIPYVIETTPRGGERGFDIYSRLLRDRIVFVGSGIDDNVANVVIAQLLFLQADKKDDPIKMYINSPGGSVTAGLAIYDTMQHVDCDVETYCIGLGASMGAVLVAGGTKGKRYALPNARILIHQVAGGTQGQASDIKIYADETLKLRDRLNKILAHHTGQPLERIENDTDRDYYMSAEEAKEYGLVDEVIGQSAQDKEE